MRDLKNIKGKIFRHFKGDLYLLQLWLTFSSMKITIVLKIIQNQYKNRDMN